MNSDYLQINVFIIVDKLSSKLLFFQIKNIIVDYDIDNSQPRIIHDYFLLPFNSNHFNKY